MRDNDPSQPSSSTPEPLRNEIMSSVLRLTVVCDSSGISAGRTSIPLDHRSPFSSPVSPRPSVEEISSRSSRAQRWLLPRHTNSNSSRTEKVFIISNEPLSISSSTESRPEHSNNSRSSSNVIPTEVSKPLRLPSPSSQLPKPR